MQRAGTVLTIFQAKDDLRSTVEATDKVRGELIISAQHGTAKITELDDVALLVDQDVVRLDVSMQDAAVLEVVQSHQHLLCIHTDSVQVQAHASTILLGQLPQVDVLQKMKCCTALCRIGRSKYISQS